MGAPRLEPGSTAASLVAALVPALQVANDAPDTYLDESRLGARPATVEMCKARFEPLFTAWAGVPMRRWKRALYVQRIADHSEWGPR